MGVTAGKEVGSLQKKTGKESKESHNQLKSLGIRSFSPLVELKYLNLNSNPWNCNDQNLCFSAVTLYDIQQKGFQNDFTRDLAPLMLKTIW